MDSDMCVMQSMIRYLDGRFWLCWLYWLYWLCWPSWLCWRLNLNLLRVTCGSISESLLRMSNNHIDWCIIIWQRITIINLLVHVVLYNNSYTHTHTERHTHTHIHTHTCGFNLFGEHLYLTQISDSDELTRLRYVLWCYNNIDPDGTRDYQTRSGLAADLQRIDQRNGGSPAIHPSIHPLMWPWTHGLNYDRNFWWWK